MTIEKFSHEKEDTHSHPIAGEYIEVSISPPDHMQYYDEPCLYDRVLRFKSYWSHRIKSQLYGFSDFMFTIEKSFPADRLHLHGLLKLQKPLQAIASLHKVLNGKFIKRTYVEDVNSAVYRIKSLEHLEARYGYITKDVPLFVAEELPNIISKKSSDLHKRLKEELLE